MEKLLLVLLLITASYSAISQQKSDCTEWDYYKTECLSNVSDGTGSSEAAIRTRICRISENDTTITVEAQVEPINGGIDTRVKAYNGIKINFRGGEQLNLSNSEFNDGGIIKRTITLNKSDLDSDYTRALNGWSKWSTMIFVTAECIYDM